MPDYTWQAIDGEFLLQVEMGGLQKTLALDTGFTSPNCAVGLHVSRSTYQNLVSVGTVLEQYSSELRLADGRTGITSIATVEAQLLYDSNPIGPRVTTFAIDGGEHAEELVGTCFFHRLQTGKLIWDLANQTLTLTFE